VDAVGDEGLGAVDDPVVTVTDGPRRDGLQIRTGIGFGHGDGADHVSRGQTREVLLLLGLRAQCHEIAGHDAVGHAPPAGDRTDAAAGDLFGSDHLEAEVRDSAAAEFLGDGQADDA
jgi:hypothetical protein